jgi:predicted TIM-barrel fold metal-dependent hydrolase
MTQTQAPSKPLLIASIDSHVSPLFPQLREYCPQKYLERYDEWANGWLSLWTDRNWFSEASPISAHWGFPFTDAVKDRTQMLVDTAGAGIYDASARVRDMDADGIACELVYHTAFTPEIFPFQEGSVMGDDAQELEAVGVRMYNRWLADFVGAEPNRMIGAAYVPMFDVDLSVEEVEFAKEHGLHCINFPAPKRTLTDYNDPVYEPFWSACADYDIPLTTHGGAGDMPPYSGKEAWALYSSDLFYYSRRGFMYMVWGGVFERHPKLQLAFTEQRSGWVTETLTELDSVYYSGFQDFSKLIPRPPSEYFHENCWLGVSFMSRFEAEGAPEVGIDRVMWGSDYPHFEGTWGYTQEHLRNTFAGLPEDHVRKMLGLNAIKLFGLDQAALEKIAERVGPSLETINRPLEELPAIPGLAFRTRGTWS